MPRQAPVHIVSAVPMIAVASVGVHGAAAPSVQEPPQVFRGQSDLVVLQVAVHDGRAVPVANLTQAEFRVFEDGAPQDIRFFISEDRPVAVGLVIDSSMSMSAKREHVIAAAEAFARSSNPSDALFTVSFNEDVWFGLPADTPFTSKVTELHDALSRIAARRQTAMYDRLAPALDHLNANPL